MKSIDYNGTKLAVFLRQSEIKKGLNFFSGEKDFIQVGTWRYDKGKLLLPHIHNTDVKRQIDRTQEVVYVIQGRLRATIFSEDEKPVDEVDAEAGDVLIMLAGGHGYEILSDDTKVLEVKNGPYVGPERDRRRLNLSAVSA